MGARSERRSRVREGDLVLSGCGALLRLAKGMAVEGTLDLRGGRAFRALPGGLRVGEDLVILGCAPWDGKVPRDASIGGKVLRLNPAGDLGRSFSALQAVSAADSISAAIKAKVASCSRRTVSGTQSSRHLFVFSPSGYP